MFKFYVFLVFFSALAALFLLLTVFRIFQVRERLLIVFLAPIVYFCTGFLMRLSASKELIDAGFFLTDFAFLFVYLLFALSLMLGQLKYWKAKV
jgi:hypothetical protein